MPLHAHLAQSLEEHSFSIDERGAPPARWLASLGVLEGVPATAFAHAIYVSQPELALLDAKRDLLVFCPCSQLVFGFPADPTTWEEAGLRWAVATDCSPVERLDERAEGAPSRRGSAHDGRYVVARVP